ncbi:hypothetical protein [Shewanella sp. 10N.286.52.A9]|uniref:hypothetical protein n=3 Tax=Shewanella TaxID=22 RepID=UPI0035532973
MALFSISFGAIIFLVSLIWMMLYTQLSSSDNALFVAMVGMLPIIFGLFIAIPSTLYRTIFVLINKPKQSLIEKVILTMGLAMTLLFGAALVDIIFR